MTFFTCRGCGRRFADFDISVEEICNCYWCFRCIVDHSHAKTEPFIYGESSQIGITEEDA